MFWHTRGLRDTKGALVKMPKKASGCLCSVFRSATLCRDATAERELGTKCVTKIKAKGLFNTIQNMNTAAPIVLRSPPSLIVSHGHSHLHGKLWRVMPGYWRTESPEGNKSTWTGTSKRHMEGGSRAPAKQIQFVLLSRTFMWCQRCFLVLLKVPSEALLDLHYEFHTDPVWVS